MTKMLNYDHWLDKGTVRVESISDTILQLNLTFSNVNKENCKPARTMFYDYSKTFIEQYHEILKFLGLYHTNYEDTIRDCVDLVSFVYDVLKDKNIRISHSSKCINYVYTKAGPIGYIHSPNYEYAIFIKPCGVDQVWHGINHLRLSLGTFEYDIPGLVRELFGISKREMNDIISNTIDYKLAELKQKSTEWHL